MTRAEYIIWRCETREQIRKEFPEKSRQYVERYLDRVEQLLRKQGYITVDDEE